MLFRRELALQKYGVDFVRIALVENEQRIRQAGPLKRFMEFHQEKRKTA